MKKTLITCLMALSAIAGNAQQEAAGTDDEFQLALEPAYLDGVTSTSGWGSNWFVEVKGGASATIVSPVGCGDLFDRTMPVLQVGLGKWITPAVGVRASYQGLQFKNANLQTMDYRFIHADLMYNLTHHLQCNSYGLSKLDVVPFVGAGMIHNTSIADNYLQADGKSIGNHPFAFSYGVELRYLIADRLHLVGEVSGMTTLKTFDGVGNACTFGDHMLNVSVGLSYTIGKRGWERVIDARPYISQNSYLLSRLSELSRYAKDADDGNRGNNGDKNSYGGLLSLRSRLADFANQREMEDSLAQQKVAVGVPVYFYFKLNTAKLVDKSQLVNLDEIAKIAKEQHLTVHITGAADSATGSDKRNRTLSAARAKYIGNQLIKRGVDKAQLKGISLGGISQFTPKEANRFGVVLLTE